MAAKNGGAEKLLRLWTDAWKGRLNAECFKNSSLKFMSELIFFYEKHLPVTLSKFIRFPLFREAGLHHVITK